MNNTLNLFLSKRPVTELDGTQTGETMHVAQILIRHEDAIFDIKDIKNPPKLEVETIDVGTMLIGYSVSSLGEALMRLGKQVKMLDNMIDIEHLFKVRTREQDEELKRIM